MSKYKPSMSDYESPGGIARMERNGMTREQIMKTMYKKTDGATREERREIVENLFDRQKS